LAFDPDTIRAMGASFDAARAIIARAARHAPA
jgi:hypothetical protein